MTLIETLVALAISLLVVGALAVSTTRAPEQVSALRAIEELLRASRVEAASTGRETLVVVTRSRVASGTKAIDLPPQVSAELPADQIEAHLLFSGNGLSMGDAVVFHGPSGDIKVQPNLDVQLQ